MSSRLLDHAQKRSAPLAVALAMFALVVGEGALAVAPQLDPGDSKRLLVVFPPWWSWSQALATAAEIAPVLNATRLGLIVAADRPEVARQLRQSGALLVVNGLVFPACLRLDPESRR